MPKHKIEVISNDTGDWTIIVLDDAVVYEGHDSFPSLCSSLMGALDIEVEHILITQEQMEKWDLQWHRRIYGE